jgi:thiol:disulfide interchange protein DsbD
VVIIGLSLLFVAMSLSMLGLFELTVPHAVSQRLANSPNSGGKRNAFVIGAIAGIVASPCVGPVLVSILAYVAKTQQLVLGFFLLFVFALGMGQIFIVLGTFSQLVRRLPRSGNWMNGTKYIFSFIMICMSIYYLSPILSPLYFNIIVAIAFQIFALIFIFKSGIPLIRALGGLILLFALVVLSGTLQKEPPRFGTVMQNLTQSIKEGPQWIPFSPEKLKEAQKSGHSGVIDFFADWCAACKELESYTFSKKSVLQAAQTKNVVWMKYDATIDNELTQIYQKMFEVRGLPTILLFDSSGLRKDLTLTGFESAEKFIERLSQLK